MLLGKANSGISLGVLLAVMVGTQACSTGRGSFIGDAGSDVGAESGMCRTQSECDDGLACTDDLCLVGGVCRHDSTCPQGMSCTAQGCRNMTQTCRSNADCNDNISCTRDTCLVDGTCRNQTQDTLCPTGQVCDPVRDCTTMRSSCQSVADCNDNIDCTIDSCGTDGMCVHVAQNNRCAQGLTCNSQMGCVRVTACESNAQCDNNNYCDGVETCSTELACVAGTPVDCNDNDPCTIDQCDNTMRMCLHSMEPSCMMMMGQNTIYDAAMSARYYCGLPELGIDAINLQVDSYQFSTIGGTLTVTTANTANPGLNIGSTPPLTGSLPVNNMFTVQGTRTGDCNEIYRLTGTFTDATHFSGTLTMELRSVLPGACLTGICDNQTWMVMGTRR